MIEVFTCPGNNAWVAGMGWVRVDIRPSGGRVWRGWRERGGRGEVLVRERQGDGDTEIMKDERGIQREMERPTDRQAETLMDRQTDSFIDRQTNSYTD